MSSSTETTTDQRREFVEGLRAFARWVEEHPEIELPYEVTTKHLRPLYSIGITGWNLETSEDQDIPETFAAAVKALGGARTKDADDGYMRVSRKFGPGVIAEVWAQRSEVCEAVVVGTETVIEDEVVEPAVTRRVEKQRDVIEWRCAPLLGAPVLGEKASV